MRAYVKEFVTVQGRHFVKEVVSLVFFAHGRPKEKCQPRLTDGAAGRGNSPAQLSWERQKVNRGKEDMKKKQEYQGIIEKVVFPNKGIAVTADGERAVVKNTIPGQQVSFVVNKIRKGKNEGRLLEVLKKGKNELEKPACPHFGMCGGCIYQNLSYEHQLELKEGQMHELFAPVLAAEGKKFEDVYEGIKPSPIGYA